MTTRFGRLRCGDAGQALIETALALPLVLLLSVSVFEFGRAFQHWQILTNAAREGARIAVLPGIDEEAVTARVQEYLDGGGLAAPDSADVSVSAAQISIGGGNTALASTVTIRYPFAFVTLQPVMQLVVRGSTVGEPITMTVSATMRNE